MTTQEFSNTFDTLLASYNTKAMFGDQSSAAEIVLDEYEKSVLLTQAQDMIVKQYFENSNVGIGFDSSERRQMDFSSLTAVATKAAIADSALDSTEVKYEDSSINFELPGDLLILLNEKVCLYDDKDKTTKQDTYVVVPINYREYDRELSKPWSQPYKKQAWRLVADRPSGKDATINSEQVTGTGLRAEIVLTDAALAKCKPTGAKTPKYKLRYIRRPKPIILTDLQTSGLNIDGKNQVSECELNPILHMDILNKAIELAYATRGGKSTAQPQQ